MTTNYLERLHGSGIDSFKIAHAEVRAHRFEESAELINPVN
ncbi:hypothetical protein AB0H69_24185 [Streptomyces phaeochromogenes]